MTQQDDILISVHSKYVEDIIAGKKLVELRRRRINVQAGVNVWIYNTMPVGKIQVCAVLKHIAVDTPAKIWVCYGAKTGLDKKNYNAYFSGSDIACALVLDDVRVLKSGLDLSGIRQKLGTFYPPQFFKRLSYDSKELDLLNGLLA